MTHAALFHPGPLKKTILVSGVRSAQTHPSSRTVVFQLTVRHVGVIRKMTAFSNGFHLQCSVPL